MGHQYGWWNLQCGWGGWNCLWGKGDRDRIPLHRLQAAAPSGHFNVHNCTSYGAACGTGSVWLSCSGLTIFMNKPWTPQMLCWFIKCIFMSKIRALSKNGEVTRALLRPSEIDDDEIMEFLMPSPPDENGGDAVAAQLQPDMTQDKIDDMWTAVEQQVAEQPPQQEPADAWQVAEQPPQQEPGRKPTRASPASRWAASPARTCRKPRASPTSKTGTLRRHDP